jgi:5-methylcytosine-specific restriction endonuclease McrA
MMPGSTSRAMKGGYADPEELPKGANGRSLCRWCNLEVPKGRRTFCSSWCVNEWRLRTDPAHVRDCVFARDNGICALCGLDTVREWRRVRRLRGAKRCDALAAWGLRRMSRVSLWDADHIVPVSEGGGECDLSNLRTLCLRCHRGVTQELRRRLATRAVRSSVNRAQRSGTRAFS